MTKGSANVLLVGTQARNLELLSEFIDKLGYRSLCALGIEQLDIILNEENTIDLALIDVTGFDVSIWQRCQHFQTKGIRLLIISPQQSLSLQYKSIIHGASSVLVKPLVMRELAKLIHALLAE
jgi:DNA-binding response OmpR family regulator